MERETAIIIGAGPAGLTAAFEFLNRTGIRPLVLEQSHYMGGISRTVNYKGNRIDIGGHRFFSKSDRVMEWWTSRMPIERTHGNAATITYQNRSRQITPSDSAPDPVTTDRVMLLRRRKSRIYFLRKFFDYPIKLNSATITRLGFARTIGAGLSYLRSMMRPIRPEQNLEQFLINRFGRRLYRLFFESYTEKVWGVPCREISAEWGAQRIKGLSISKAVAHFLKGQAKAGSDGEPDISQKGTETSLIEHFLYPKFGPGQLWDCVACEVRKLGGEILCGWRVERILTSDDHVTSVEAVHEETGERRLYHGDYFLSTMPIKDLIRGMGAVPEPVRQVSEGLLYRDFITVGILLDRLRIGDDGSGVGTTLSDNWLYVQEPDVLVGRIQIFNNWSPFMVRDTNQVWLGLEYFCYETDPIWRYPDDRMIELAKDELARLGIASPDDVLDATVIRMPKTYPAYFGTYDRFEEIRSYLDRFENLYPIGRNGMHKYNNQDHSMLTAMTAVDNIAAGIRDKAAIWEINTEQEYHETRS
jgi:protoporphyrinogen oxidase